MLHGVCVYSSVLLQPLGVQSCPRPAHAITPSGQTDVEFAAPETFDGIFYEFGLFRRGTNLFSLLDSVG